MPRKTSRRISIKRPEVVPNWQIVYKRYSAIFHVLNVFTALAEFGIPMLTGLTEFMPMKVYVILVCIFSIFGFAGSYIKQNLESDKKLEEALDEKAPK